MDLKRLGVSIDPRGAQSGAAQVEKAVGRMGGTIRRVLTTADRGFLRVGTRVKQVGAAVTRTTPALTGFQRVIANIKRSAGGTFQKLTAGFRRTGSEATKAGKKVRGAGDDMAFLKAQTVLATSGMFRASQAMAFFGAAATGAIAALAPLLAVLLPIIIAVKLLSALLGAGIAGTKLAGEVQRLRISFTALTGSEREANKVLSELRKTALETGIEVADQAKTVQKFIALGFKSDKAIQLQRNILDVAGAVGLTAVEAKLLGSALAQVQSKGVVSMEELRQQIAEKGIPAIDELMRKTNLYGKAFFDAIAKGEVPAKELIDIFLNLEGTFAKFAGGAKRLAGSIPGQVNIIKTSWQEMLREMGAPIADAIGPILDDLINILQTAAPFGAAMGRAIGDAIRILYGAISDGTLEDLLGTAFMAGVETGLNFLGNGFADIVLSFGATLVSGIEFAAKTLKNVFLEAFANVINFFISGIEKGIQVMGDVLAKMALVLNEVTGSNLSVAPFALGSIERAESESDDRTLDDILKANQEIAAAVAGDIGKDPFGTFFQDKAARQAQNLLEKSFKATPKGSFKFDEDEVKPPGAETGTDVSKAGKAKVVNEQLTIQLGILAELQQRLTALTTEWLNMGTAITDIAEGSITGFADNLSSALTNIASGAESVGQAFANMANAIVQSIVQMVIQMTVQLAVAQALAALGVPVGVVGTFATAAKAIPVSHAGGVGGNVKTGRGGFSKFHNGGALSSENLSLTDQNETVLTRRRAVEIEKELRSARETKTTDEGGQGRPFQIINVLDQAEVLGMVAANPDVIVNGIRRRRRQVDGVLKSR